MKFKLGTRSLRNLEYVHPKLVGVVHEAIKLTDVDFAVHEGIRSELRQSQLVKMGASRTLDSRHLLQDDGFGHAVDLVPYFHQQLRWDWPLCYRVAAAMQKAAKILDVRLVWGGVWDECLNDLSPDLETEVEQYVVRRRSRGLKAFIDGPHFQIED